MAVVEEVINVLVVELELARTVVVEDLEAFLP